MQLNVLASIRGNKDVLSLILIDETDEVRGSFYLDLYACENKRGGAWMDDCIGRNAMPTVQFKNLLPYLTW